MRWTASEILIVFQEEFRAYIRRKMWIVLTAAIPAILLVLAIAVPVFKNLTAARAPGAATAGYVDLSGRLPFDKIQDRFPALARYPDRTAGEAALAAGEIDDLFVVPADYLTAGRIEWRYAGKGFMPDEGASHLFLSFLRQALAAGMENEKVAARLLSPASFERLRVSAEGESREGDDSKQRFMASMAFAALIMVSILFASGSLLHSVSEEKENRMIELLITAIAPAALLAGKVLAFGAAGLLQLAVWLPSIAILGPRITDGVPAIGELAIDPALPVFAVLFFLAGYFFIGVVMAGIGAVATSVREANSLGPFIAIPLYAPLWFATPIESNPAGGLATALSFIPVTAPTTMMLRMGLADVSPFQIAGSLLATLAGGVLALWVCARVFRAGLLMYGQRMGVKAVVAALRQSG